MLDINTTKVDPLKFKEGTYWALSVDPNSGTFLADIADAPPANKGWVRVAVPGLQYDRALLDAQEPYRERIREGKLTDEERAKIEGEALVRGSVLKEWGNIAIGGVPIPYSVEKAVEMLTDVRWTNFRMIIDAVARNRAALREREIEAAKGNSQGGSGGSFEGPARAAMTHSSSA